jgi:hypothetical protein
MRCFRYKDGMGRMKPGVQTKEELGERSYRDPLAKIIWMVTQLVKYHITMNFLLIKIKQEFTKVVAGMMSIFSPAEDS